jgi:protein-tyrosine-phosphatase
MSNLNSNVEKLTRDLMSDSDIILLQAMDETKRFCRENPKKSKKLIPLVKLLTNNKHPWVKKEAVKCYNLLKKLDRNYSKKIRLKKGSKTESISDIDDFISLLISMLSEKAYNKDKIKEIYNKINTKSTETLPPIQEQIHAILSAKDLKYFKALFSEREIYKISLKLEIPIEKQLNDIDLILLKIYEKIGLKLTRGHYIEF